MLEPDAADRAIAGATERTYQPTPADINTLWQQPAPGDTRLEMQADGNLVLYSTAGNPLWWSGTGGNPGAYARLQDDGTLVVLSSTGTALWSHEIDDDRLEHTPGEFAQLLPTGHRLTNASKSVHLVMQQDGNLVAYGPNGVLWASGTWGNPGAYLALQIDGNLAIYPNTWGQAIWASNTNLPPNQAHNLVVQADGNIVAYATKRAVWQTNTRAK